jgi:hypothetical protein
MLNVTHPQLYVIENANRVVSPLRIKRQADVAWIASAERSSPPGWFRTPANSRVLIIQISGDDATILLAATMLARISVPVALLLVTYLCRPSLYTTMSEHTFDWLREKTIGWSHTPPVNKIDTHHHCVPPFYAKGKPSPSTVWTTSLTTSQRSKNKAATPVAGQHHPGTRWPPNCS